MAVKHVYITRAETVEAGKPTIQGAYFSITQAKLMFANENLEFETVEI